MKTMKDCKPVGFRVSLQGEIIEVVGDKFRVSSEGDLMIYSGSFEVFHASRMTWSYCRAIFRNTVRA